MSEVLGSLGASAPSCGSLKVSQPAYVTTALNSLTGAQARYVKDGCIHGDPTMQTLRALQDKALFYLVIDSPNGRCGHLALTPLGKTVRSILLAREGERSEVRATPKTSEPPQKDNGQ